MKLENAEKINSYQSRSQLKKNMGSVTAYVGLFSNFTYEFLTCYLYLGSSKLHHLGTPNLFSFGYCRDAPNIKALAGDKKCL